MLIHTKVQSHEQNFLMIIQILSLPDEKQAYPGVIHQIKSEKIRRKLYHDNNSPVTWENLRENYLDELDTQSCSEDNVTPLPPMARGQLYSTTAMAHLVY